MKFSIKVRVKSLRRATRKAMDAEITAILGGTADDAKVDGAQVWRRFGNVEIIDRTNSKAISGDAEPETVTALRRVMSNYGCEAA